MGAWGVGNFENDEALDFVAELTGPNVLTRTLAGLAPPGEGYIEATEASHAMACAEVVAAMLGHPGADFPEELLARMATFGAPDAALVEMARGAVSRVLQESELAELWAEADDPEAWNLTVTDLIERLNTPRGGSGGA